MLPQPKTYARRGSVSENGRRNRVGERKQRKAEPRTESSSKPG